jgi:REP element-mobilizing transposase RayT
MQPIGYHVTTRLLDNRVIARTAGPRRAVSRFLCRAGEEAGLLAWRLADTHLHLLLTCDRKMAGRFVQRVDVSMHAHVRPGVPFSRFWHEPIRSQGHLANAFGYILRQETRHGLETDPLHEGSNLSDLLGLRVGATWSPTLVRRLLPRTSRGQLVAWLTQGLRGLPEELLLGEGDVPLTHLRDAAAAAALVRIANSRSPVALGARLAAVHAVAGGERRRGGRVGLAAALGLSTRTIRRLRRCESDPRLVRAIRIQAGIRHWASIALGFGRDRPL